MADVNEIIYFIKSLKKGFDKDLFHTKIDELAYAVDTHGLMYEDFHTLFQVWLNLSIPISRWVSLGSCMVPPDIVEARTVKYAFRWLLANMYNRANQSRVVYLLDWLTAAMECESIDMVALDTGYEIFFSLLMSGVLTAHVLKLVYTLTKPVDVTRKRVRELQAYEHIREARKDMCRQLQVLLGLFKSYKPECVPEDVPAISINAAFNKLNVPLLARFKKNQEKRNRSSKKTHLLLWTNPLNSDRRNKKAVPLVPKLQHINERNIAKPTKNYLDFTDPVSLVQYSRHHIIARPAQLRSLLCNETGLAFLTVMPHSTQAFMSHEVYQLLQNCFLGVSPYSYAEKQDFLRRLALLQRTALQGVPVLSRFLAQYLPLWNETDYVYEILNLVEYVSILYPEQIKSIVECLSRFYRRARPLEQCAILKSLTAMYTNLVYASKKTRYHFLDIAPLQKNYQLVLPFVASQISDLCNTELQVNPDDLRILYTSLWSAEKRALSEQQHGAAIGALPRPLTLALPLLSVAAGLIDTVAGLMILYQKIISATEDKNEEHIHICTTYLLDMINCLYSEVALSNRSKGLIFQKLHPQLVCKLTSVIPDVDAKLSLRNHVAYALYTRLMSLDNMQGTDNILCFRTVIDKEFPKLCKLMKRAVNDLR